MTSITPHLPFGLLLKRYRRAAGLTQATLAERAGFSVSYISMLERGERAALPGTIALLAAALGLSEAEQAEFMSFADLAREPHLAAAATPEAALMSLTSLASPTQVSHRLPIGGFLGTQPEGPLIGHEQEFTRVLTALDVAVRGAGQLVLLVGESGVGKTRLAQELTRMALNQGLVVAMGRCYAPQQAVGFFPFMEAMATLDAALPPALRAEMPRRWPDVTRLIPDRLEVTAAPMSSAAGPENQARLFWQITGMIQALAVTQPVALLLDDLHWADSASLNLLQHLARHTRGARVLLLGTHRPEEVPRQAALRATLGELAHEHLAVRISLHPLPLEGTGRLVAATLGVETIPGTFATMVQEATEGNPFFVQEVVRALVEQGDLYRTGDEWRQREPAEMSVPENVRAVIAERAGRLAALTQAVLAAASVLGQTFDFDDLWHLHMRLNDSPSRQDEPSEEAVETALREATAAGLVHAASKGEEYSFKHALTQRALYVELPARRRRRIHSAAAAVIEALPERKRAPRIAELAWHLLQADEREHALPYLLAAGDQADAVFAYAQAERHFQIAVEVAQDVEHQEAEAREKLGGALHHLAHYEKASAEFERAAELYRVAGDHAKRWRAVAGRAGAHEQLGQPGIGLAHVRAAIAEADAIPESASLYAHGLAALFIQAANLSMQSGRYTETLPAARRATELAQLAGDAELLVAACGRFGVALAVNGQWQDAVSALLDTVRLGEQNGHLGAASNSLINLSDIYLHRGDFATAGQFLQRAVEIDERTNEVTRAVFSVNCLVEWSFFRGDWADADRYSEHAHLLAERSGQSFNALYVSLHQGLVSLARGDIDAMTTLSRVIAAAQSCEDAQVLHFAQWVLAEHDLLHGKHESAQARLEQGLDHSGRLPYDACLLSARAWAELLADQLDRARATLSQAERLATNIDDRLALVDIARVRALLLMRQSCWAEATHALEDAIALCQAMPYPYAEAKAQWVFGQLEMAQDQPARARERYEQALTILKRLGERLYAQHIERALAALSATHVR